MRRSPDVTRLPMKPVISMFMGILRRVRKRQKNLIVHQNAAFRTVLNADNDITPLTHGQSWSAAPNWSATGVRHRGGFFWAEDGKRQPCAQRKSDPDYTEIKSGSREFTMWRIISCGHKVRQRGAVSIQTIVRFARLRRGGSTVLNLCGCLTLSNITTTRLPASPTHHCWIKFLPAEADCTCRRL